MTTPKKDNDDDVGIVSNKRIGCIGGGQLGRMMALEAPRLSIDMSFLDSTGTNCPASQVVATNRIVHGSLKDREKIHELVFGEDNKEKKTKQNVDIVTVEIEHVNVDALKELEQNNNVIVRPSSSVLRIISDKFIQKQHFEKHGIAIPKFREITTIQSVIDTTNELGLPLMLKTRKGGYDGRGNSVLKSNDLQAIYSSLQDLGVMKKEDEGKEKDLIFDNVYAEGWIEFQYEIAVMVVRSCKPLLYKTKCYPTVTAIQENSICRLVLVPARNVSIELQKNAQELAIQAIDSFSDDDGACGVFGVEMFVTNNGEVLINEIAPRPHNTGHYTQLACITSQFENHLRAISGMPLGNTDLVVNHAAMVNILGAKSGTMKDTMASSNAALNMSNTQIHWYGKKECRKGRKMGHINLATNDMSTIQLDQSMKRLMELENISMSLLPGNDNDDTTKTTEGNVATKKHELETSISPCVSIVMGSQSDLPTMYDAVKILQQFEIPYEVDIVSAHRTPEKLMNFAKTAHTRGIAAIIAGAGGAAHLPGMIASMTPIPVIGVPVKTSTLNGVDSLHSIVQMPRGVPVATVAIGNATNAGLLAVRILSTKQPQLVNKMLQYQKNMKDMVNETSTRLLDVGSDEYLKQMGNKNKSVNV